MVKPVWNNAQRVNHQNFSQKNHPCAKKNLVPRAVLIKSGLVSINTARQNISKTAVLVNTARQVNAAHLKTTVNAVRPMSYLSKTAHSTVKRPIHKNTTFKNSNINQRVNTVRGKNVNTARPKAVVNAVKGNNFNADKASACWVWKPKHKVLNHGNPQMDLHDQGIIDSGFSRHMTGNMSYLTDYEEIDGGYVAFGRNPKGGKITGKGNLVRGLPSKLFENDQTCVACQKGKQHRASFVSDDYNRFTWVFFLATKDETSGILKSFITGIENLVDHKVKNSSKNRVAERRNRTLIKAARTMLADSKLPTTFWAEAVNIACYVQNRVLVVKPHNKTPYELFHGKTPTLSFMRPFGCHVTIFNTIDHLGKFDGKADEGLFVGYSLNSKAFRVFNSRTRIVEENLHIRFSENTPNVVGSGPDWLFDIDALTRTMNYEPIIADPKSSNDNGSKPLSNDGKKVDKDQRKDTECNGQEKKDNINSTNNVNVAATYEVNVVGGKTSIELPFDPNMPALEDYSILDFSRDDEDDGAEAYMNNLDITIQVSPNPTIRIHKDHPLDQVIRDLQSATQTRKMSKNLKEHGKNPKRNKKDKRGIMIRNKARLVAQGYTQEEGINYDEVFAPVARIEAIRLFLAYASFKDFMVYQMDVKSDFLYGKIEEEVYVCQPPGFEDPNFPDRVYKVEKAMYGLHQAPRAWFIEVKTASTPIETQNPLLKDEDIEEVHVHMYRSMIGSLMYLTSLRPDIMFAVCACARYQANPKVSHLHAVKRIFRYLKGQPKLGLWYPKILLLIWLQILQQKLSMWLLQVAVDKCFRFRINYLIWV
ncbi:retrovirus-related pol polyprotein from transposon TNT 1-94 [Tanacetum coccineum]